MIRGSNGRGSQRSRPSSSKSKTAIAVTSSSAHPYSMSGGGADGRSPDSVDQGSTSSILNGSFGSIESSSYGTTSSIISGSSVSSNPMALSPRKSSLKKPRPRNEVPASPVPEGSETGSVLGFQNPGFGEPRVGSIKRVRIASQSTDVWLDDDRAAFWLFPKSALWRTIDCLRGNLAHMHCGERKLRLHSKLLPSVRVILTGV